MFRVASVSSIRSRNQSPKSRFATALRALPTWSDPVGLGAKRTLVIQISLEVERVPDVERVGRELDDPRLAVLAPSASFVEAPRADVVLEHPEPACRGAEPSHLVERPVVELVREPRAPTLGDDVEPLEPAVG